MHENKRFAPAMIFFTTEMFMCIWAVHNFMHANFTHENFMHENEIDSDWYNMLGGIHRDGFLSSTRYIAFINPLLPEL